MSHNYSLYTTPTFERRLKAFLKKHPELEEILIKKLSLLVKNPFHPSLKTHKLTGKLKRHHAIWLTYEYRILFILEGNNIFLTNIGAHDEVY